MAFFDTGEKIREIRISENLSQEQLAELASLNRVTIAKYESGRVEPGAHALSRIADALNTSVDILLGRAEPSQEPSGAPKTNESRIISESVDRMPPEAREKALNVLRTIYAEYFTMPEDRIG